MRKTKKGFTIVELVIVIAVIGVLAAVLIPTFINLNAKANKAADDSLVKNLNTALATQEQLPEDEKNVNFHEAIKDLDDYGYKLTNLVTKSEDKLLWNSKTNRFLLAGNIGKETNSERPYEFWKISDSFDNSGYSIYAGNNFNEENPVNITNGVGFDVGYKTITSINYSRAYTTEGTTGHDVVIRTNSAATSLTINASNDVVKHYGSVGSLDIQAVKGDSYHEFGKAAFVEIKTGRIALEKGAEVTNIHLNATGGVFNDITIAKAEEVMMPEFTRDPVTIPAEGAKIVALQTSTADDADKDYVWLTVAGVYEQVTLGTETEAGTTYAAESGDATQKEAAAQIANNITFSKGNTDYKVTATKTGDTWTYEVKTSTGEETTYTAEISSNNIVVKDSSENVIETKNETAVTPEEKAEKKAEAIDELAGEEVAEDSEAENYVARIGTKGFLTFAEAYHESTNGSKIVLLKNVLLGDVIEGNFVQENLTTSFDFDKAGITLDLNGNSLVSSANVSFAFNIKSGADLTIKDSVGGGMIRGTNAKNVIQCSGTIKLYSGTIQSEYTVSGGTEVLSVDGTAYIYGGTISSLTNSIYTGYEYLGPIFNFTLNNRENAHTYIYGGTFSCATKEGLYNGIGNCGHLHIMTDITTEGLYWTNDNGGNGAGYATSITVAEGKNFTVDGYYAYNNLSNKKAMTLTGNLVYNPDKYTTE